MRLTGVITIGLVATLGCGASSGLDGCTDCDALDASVSALDGGETDASTRPDAGTADAGDPCVGATDGARCTVEGAECGGPCTSACEFCNLLRCSGGRWTHLEVFPASCFACGGTLECVSHYEYCERSVSDVAGHPDEYRCVPLPDDCLADTSCQCLEENAAFDRCTDHGGGRLEVQLFGG